MKDRADRDPEFRRSLLEEAIDLMTSGEIDTGKTMLRDYVNATVGFQALAKELDVDPGNLMRMLSEAGNPTVGKLFPVLAILKAREGVGVRLEERMPS